GSLLGNGSTLNDGVILGKECLFAAGITVTENTEFEDRSLIRGTPGKALGKIREKHAELMRGAANSYVNRIDRYKSAGLDTDS
ncbi:MAG: gamma carbonic anhydrase family protein, partial [Chloroflexota bacterium]